MTPFRMLAQCDIGPFKRIGRDLAQTHGADASLPDLVSQCSHALVDAGAIVFHSVQVVKIDGCLQPIERALDGPPQILRRSIDTPSGDIGPVPKNAPLGGQNNVCPQRVVAQHASHQFLIVAKAIDVGRVEESFASVEGVVNQVTRSSIIAGTIELGHAHAAQADGADGQTIVTRLTDRQRIRRAWGAGAMR